MKRRALEKVNDDDARNAVVAAKQDAA